MTMGDKGHRAEGKPRMSSHDVCFPPVMRMLLCSCLLTVALGLSPVVVLGDAQSHRKAAENLLILSRRSGQLVTRETEWLSPPVPGVGGVSTGRLSPSASH